MTRDEFDENTLDLIEAGRMVAILRGQRVMLIDPSNIKPHMHILSAAEAKKRLNLHRRQRTLLQRIWDWVRD